MVYQVRTKKFETHRWVVVSEHDTEKDARKAASKLERSNRLNPDRMYDHVEVKYPDGTRFVYA